MPAEWVEGESGVWTCKEHVLETKFRPLEAALGVKVVDDPARVLRFTISDQAPDRSNDRMNQKGMITTDYERSPLVYFQHAPRFDPTAKPIARTLKIKKERGEVPFTWADAIYAGDEQRHEEAELCYRLARDGFITSASVGFVPLERKDLPSKDRKQGGYPGFEILSWDLREWSNVGIPDNVRATRHPGVAPSKGWDVARLRDVAREFIEGSRLDAFVKSFTGEETIEVTTVPATPPTPRTNDLPDEGFDHWPARLGKAAPAWSTVPAAAKAEPETSVKTTTEATTLDVTKAEAAIEALTARVTVLVAAIDAVQAKAAALPQAGAQTAQAPDLDAIKAHIDASVKALGDEISRRHDYALAELFGFTERKQEAALKAARATPRDPAAVPVSAEKGEQPPSGSNGSIQPLSVETFASALAAARQVKKERAQGVVR